MKEMVRPNVLELLGKMFVQIDVDNKVINVNSQTCEVLGYAKDEILGKDWYKNFVPKSEKREAYNSSTVLDLFYDKPVLTKSGEIRMISWHMTEIFTELGELESIICVGDDVSKHENYLLTLHQISSLLVPDSPSVPFGEFARLVGEAAHADHTYVFVNTKNSKGEVISKKVSEWGRGEFIENADILPSLNNIKIGSFAKELAQKITSGLSINLKTSAFPEKEKAFFYNLNIKAILLIPIIVEKQFYGFVGFDNRKKEREWTNAEMKFLTASVNNLEQRIIRNVTLKALRLESSKFQATMDAIESKVFVSSFDTNKLIFINKFAAQSVGKVLGQKLSAVLGLDTPLPVGYNDNKGLLNTDNLPNEATEWYLESNSNEKLYTSKVKAIKWTNNEWVRLETIVDVTEKKKSEKVLLESEAKFRKLSALTIEGIIIHNMGVIIEANLAFCNILGYSYEELIGVNVIDLAVLPEYHAFLFEKLKEKNPEPYEVYARRKEGEIFPAEVEAKSITYGDELLRVVAIRDITDRKKAEQELIRQKEKAEEGNRLKTQFLNNMSHEIRTPLNGIVGFTQFLDDPDLSSEKKSHFVNIIQSSSAQLARIIDDIIEISKLETKQVKARMEKVNLNSILFELFSIFEIKAREKQVALHLNKGLNDSQSEIYTDKTKILKILNNLVENALKFTAKGEVEIGYSLNDNKLKIWVKDSGIGIASNKHAVIFERFSQAGSDTSTEYGGLGLGLSIAKENTELIGGEISLESSINEGAKFSVVIPYKPVHPKLSKFEQNSEETHDFHVLIAEDEEVNFIFLEFLLQGFNDNMKIHNVRNGQEAIDYCLEHRDIDLILMDLKMPVLSGFDAAIKIKESFPNIPIVAISAFSGGQEKQRAIDLGFLDFLMKPIDVSYFNKLCYSILKK